MKTSLQITELDPMELITGDIGKHGFRFVRTPSGISLALLKEDGQGIKTNRFQTHIDPTGLVIPTKGSAAVLLAGTDSIQLAFQAPINDSAPELEIAQIAELQANVRHLSTNRKLPVALVGGIVDIHRGDFAVTSTFGESGPFTRIFSPELGNASVSISYGQLIGVPEITAALILSTGAYTEYGVRVTAYNAAVSDRTTLGETQAAEMAQ
jgi:hypothetical protein